jgi:TonB family protein
MRALWVVALFVVLGAGFSGGQQASPSAGSKQADAQPARVKIYSAGPGVTAPELLPVNQPPIPDEKCKKKQRVDGKVVLSLLVDETGKPRNIMFLQPVGSDLDEFALRLAIGDRFKPGTHDGAPVVVAQSAEVDMHACAEEKTDDAGKKSYWLQLRSQPVQTFGALPEPPEEAVLTTDTPTDIPVRTDSKNADFKALKAEGRVTGPVILKHVVPQYSEEARRAKYQGVCLITLIVDAHGMPQNVHVTRGLGMGLDEKAVEAVRGFRFKPATKDGKPVASIATIEVNFRLY